MSLCEGVVTKHDDTIQGDAIAICDRLDAFMDREGLDWILATSDHNVRYILNGHRNLQFAARAAIGLSRFLPIAVYARGRRQDAFYVGSHQEQAQLEVQPIWPDTFEAAPASSLAAATLAAERLDRRGGAGSRIGVEPSFLPADAMRVIKSTLPHASFVDATSTLEAIRAIKFGWEIQRLRRASEGTVSAMQRVFRQVSEGMSKARVASILAREALEAGLNYEYSFIGSGSSLNRAPTGAPVQQGPLPIDSGCEYEGYIGDLCRMGAVGRLPPEAHNALAEVEAVQVAARSAAAPGAAGRAIHEAAEMTIKRCAYRGQMRFIAHGMGLLAHEAPHLVDSVQVPYRGQHADEELQVGMVLSIETHIASERFGFVKVEDTVLVTESGAELLGGGGRGWN